MKNETPQEPICPTCGNNAQVWTNQISGEKVCHRAGCHRTITETPHPLAVEAASHVIREYVENVQDFEERDIANRIHTTALEPVIKAGEEMDNALGHIIDFLDRYRNDQEYVGLQDIEAMECDIQAAITQWRTLTNPKTGDSTPLEGSRSDFKPQGGVTGAGKPV